MLIEEYKKIEGKELKIPKEIREVTDRYIGENNYSLRYINEETNKEDEGEVSLKDLHSEMRRWMLDHHTRKKIPDIGTFSDELIDQGYEISNGQVCGLTVKY